MELTIFRKNGRKTRIQFAPTTGGADSQFTAALARLNDGIEKANSVDATDDEKLLARSSRDLATWVDAMRSIGLDEMGIYRTRSIPRERLWETLENAAANPSARKGAALALHARLDDEERARIEALARRTASPRFRVALHAVSHEKEPARLRLALENDDDEIEPEAPTRHARRAR